MDKRPKRIRDKYNPYILYSEAENSVYKVTFFNKKESISIDITKEIFDELDEFEKDDARQIQKIARHNELNVVTETTLNKRAFEKQVNIDEVVINRINNEKLHKAMDKLTKQQRRRILLYYDYQLSMEEIARIECCSKQSIQESIDWGIKKLKKFFGKF